MMATGPYPKNLARAICFFLPLVLGACSSTRKSAAPAEVFSSAQVKAWLRQALPAVLGVSAVYNYQVTRFHHQLDNGKLVPDADSPTGYRLLPQPLGAVAMRETDMQKVTGGGLIIHRDERKAVVLTSAHVFNKPDTINHFDRADTSQGGRLLLARALQKSKSFYVIHDNGLYFDAEILHKDHRLDLALLLVPSAPTLGANFPFVLDAPGKIEWGDFVYVIGYPREVKQLSTGVVSRAPYPGSFILDTVARFGFSGGPVLVLRPEQGLCLAGLVRGVPANKLRYVAPPKDAPAGQQLNERDLQELASQEIDMIDYGTTYVVGNDFIKKFLREANEILQRKHITLDPKYWQD